MKKLQYSFILLLLIVSCKGRDNLKEKSVFNSSFQDYTEISAFRDFEKISDTSIYTWKTNEDFRLLHLKKNREMVVLFYKVKNSDIPGSPEYEALDTLRVFDLKSSERFTIGYCQKEGLADEQIIAVVKDTTGLYMDVAKAWIANLETQTFENLSEVKGIKCLNVFYELPREAEVPLNNFPKQ